jgi:hypothetical protein
MDPHSWSGRFAPNGLSVWSNRTSRNVQTSRSAGSARINVSGQPFHGLPFQ